MFNAEKLLGQIMGDALSGGLGGSKRKHKRQSSGLSGLLGGVSGGTKAKLGVGLLGLAFAAYEHYKQPGNSAAVSSGSSSPPPPPPPPLSNPSSAASPPSPIASTLVNHENALHLIRAMMTAADADGLIDAQERESILARAREADMDADNLRVLEAEISAPMNLKQLVARTPENLRDETYAAALIAITANTPEERDFLDQLASALALDAKARQDIHQQLGM